MGDLYFVGANGWYTMDVEGDIEENKRIYFKRDREGPTYNDNHNIGFDAKVQPQPWELAERDARHIDESITRVLAGDPDARFIVVTHTLPHRDLLHQKPEYLWSAPFYVNSLMEDVMERHADVIGNWVHGHTHYRSLKRLKGVEVVCNPRGGPRDNPDWTPVVLETRDVA